MRRLFVFMSLGLCFLSCKRSPEGFVRIRPFNAQFRNDSAIIHVPATFPLTEQENDSEIPLSFISKDFREYFNRDLEVESIIDDYEYVPLETTEKSVIGMIDEVLNDSDQLFFVDYTHDKILSFDREGRFICQIGERGNGHGEYVTMENCALNKGTKEICILDWSTKRLQFYSYQGKYTRTVPMYYYHEAVAFIDNYTCLLTVFNENPDIPGIQGCHIVVCHKDMKPIFGVLTNRGFPAWTEFSTNFTHRYRRPLRTYPDGIYYADILSPDTLWRYDGRLCRNALSVDFGDDNIFTTPEEYSSMTTEKYEKRVNEVPYVVDYELSRNFIWLYISALQTLIVDRQNKTFVSGMFVNKKYDRPTILPRLLNFPLHNPPFLFDWKDDKFVFLLEPSEISKLKESYLRDAEKTMWYNRLPEKDRKILDSADDENNPIMLVVKLKS